MKNQKGFAPVIVILIVVLLGAGTYAVVNREVLKGYFEKGDKPTPKERTEPKDKFEDGDIPTEENSVGGDKPEASQFSAFIDSSLNYYEDNKKPESPDNLFPESEKKLTIEEAMKPITFRWTALVPKPSEPSTYRLKVWQLMQGQNGTQAMKSNQPIVTKDVDNITEVTVGGIYTGPCKPPYLCDYIWQVQVVDSAGNSEKASEPSTFSVSVSEERASEQGAGTAAGMR